MEEGGGNHQDDRPQPEDHFHLSEEMQDFGRGTRGRRPAVGARLLVQAMLQVVRRLRESRGGEGVNDGEQEDAGRDAVEWIQGDAVRQSGDQAGG